MVRVLYSHPKANINRFGWEGTGVQCILPYSWMIGDVYQFEVRAIPHKERVEYSAYIKNSKEYEWTYLATYLALSDCEGIKGLYSFIEDFRRDGRTPFLRRSAIFVDGYIIDKQDNKYELRRAVFDADNNRLTNINAESVKNGFRLSTGGPVSQKPSLNLNCFIETNNLHRI